MTLSSACTTDWQRDHARARGRVQRGVVFSSAALIAQYINRRQSVALAVAAVMRRGFKLSCS